MMQFLMRSEQPVKCSIFRPLPPSPPPPPWQTFKLCKFDGTPPNYHVSSLSSRSKYMITSCFITRGSSCAALTSSSRIINTPPSPLLLYRILIKTRGKLFQTFSKNFVLKKKKEELRTSVSYLATWNEKRRKEWDGERRTTHANQSVSQSLSSSLSCGHCGHCVPTFDCQYVVRSPLSPCHQADIYFRLLLAIRSLRASDF